VWDPLGYLCIEPIARTISLPTSNCVDVTVDCLTDPWNQFRYGKLIPYFYEFI